MLSFFYFFHQMLGVNNWKIFKLSFIKCKKNHENFLTWMSSDVLYLQWYNDIFHDRLQHEVWPPRIHNLIYNNSNDIPQDIPNQPQHFKYDPRYPSPIILYNLSFSFLTLPTTARSTFMWKWINQIKRHLSVNSIQKINKFSTQNLSWNLITKTC